MDTTLKDLNPSFDQSGMTMPVISEQAVENIHLSANEALFTDSGGILQKILSMRNSGPIELRGQNEVIPQQYKGINMSTPVSGYFTSGGLPVAIVDEAIFERLKKDLNPAIQKSSSVYIGIDIKDNAKVKEANELFREMGFSSKRSYNSQLEMSNNQKQNMGLIMFIVGFLGLTFLITSGCILYFKQMDESEDEKSNYTILRKLGFTQGDLLKGIQAKQVFNFGIPLVVGLLHSYFAVQSGWFFFGTELWTPMIMVMILYTALYSIFGILSVYYYKKVIKEAL
jgi:bacitracin transport system permease protein